MSLVDARACGDEIGVRWTGVVAVIALAVMAVASVGIEQRHLSKVECERLEKRLGMLQEDATEIRDAATREELARAEGNHQRIWAAECDARR